MDKPTEIFILTPKKFTVKEYRELMEDMLFKIKKSREMELKFIDDQKARGYYIAMAQTLIEGRDYVIRNKPRIKMILSQSRVELGLRGEYLKQSGYHSLR